jgi:hypothetical protein
MTMKALTRTFMAAILASAIPGCALEANDIGDEEVEGVAQAVNKGTEISRGEYLLKGDYLSRRMSGYSVQLIMQQDGNLVLKRTTGRVCWWTRTADHGKHAVYQRDGNFVVVNDSGKAIWASHTVDGGSGESGQTVSISVAGVLWAGYKRISGC